MAQEYWVKREDKIYGPYSGGKLKKFAGEGKIGPNDLISTDKRAWQLAEIVRGLSLCATVKPPQTAVVAVAPPPLEVSPSTGSASRTHHQRTSSSRYEQRFPPRTSRSRWIVIGVTGVAVVGLALVVAIWLWTPQGGGMTSKELAQSDDNMQDKGRSSAKPDVTRTTPAPPTHRAVTKPPDSRKSPLPVTTPSPEKNAVAKKPSVTVEQFKAAAADLRTYMRSMGWPENEPIDRILASVLLYGRGDKYEQAEARGQASLENLFEQTAASRDALRGRCFYLDVSSKSYWPVFVHDWSKGKATVTVTTPFEARGGGDGLSTFAFRQCDDPRADFYNSSVFGVLLESGKLRTTSQYSGRNIGGLAPGTWGSGMNIGDSVNSQIYGSEAMDLADKGFVIYTQKQPYTYIKLPHVNISAEQADRYGIRRTGGGLRARIYFTELRYAGPVGTHERLRRKVRYFRLDQARRSGSVHLENAIYERNAKQPNVFVTTMNDPNDYVLAKVVAIEVRTPEGALLADVAVGTERCSCLTSENIASQASSVAGSKKAFTGILSRARSLMDRGDLDQAASELARARAIFPNDSRLGKVANDVADAYSNKGEACDKLGQYADAIDACKKAIALKPDQADAYFNMGRAYCDLKQYRDAVAAYKKYIVLKPDAPSAYFNIGYAYSELKQYTDAVAVYKKYIALKPDDPYAYFNMGRAYCDLKQYRDAVAAYKKYIALKPDAPSAYFNIGYAYSELKQYTDAVAVYKKYIALKPDDPYAYFNIGIAYHNLKQYTGAIAAYKKAIALKPNHADAYFNMGLIYDDELRKYAYALAAFEKYIAIGPTGKSLSASQRRATAEARIRYLKHYLRK